VHGGEDLHVGGRSAVVDLQRTRPAAGAEFPLIVTIGAPTGTMMESVTASVPLPVFVGTIVVSSRVVSIPPPKLTLPPVFRTSESMVSEKPPSASVPPFSHTSDPAGRARSVH
jgi:hypothetical protein